MELLGWLAAALGVFLLGVVVWSVARRGAERAEPRSASRSRCVPYAAGPSARSRECLRRLARHRRPRHADGAAVRDPRRDLRERVRAEGDPERRRASTLDVLDGVPAIVIGVFVFGLIVVGHGQSGYAGAFALAVLMLPLVARSTIEVLALVPTRCARRRSASERRAGGRRSGSSSRRRSAASSPARRSPSRASPARRRRCSSPARSSARDPLEPVHSRSQTVPVAIFELSESSEPSRITRSPGRRRSC